MTLDGFEIPSTVLRHFNLTSTPWTSLFHERIQKRRQTFPDGLLFIDRLLETAQLDGLAHYPPTTPAAVRRLLSAINGCAFDRLMQDCLYYYLLKDYDAGSPTANGDGDLEMDQAQSPVGQAAEFANRRCLPKVWAGFVDGYWALDNADWENAVRALSSPAISELNFLPAILSVLASNVPTATQAAVLIHKLLSTADRPLATPEETEIKLLAQTSAAGLLDAFSWIRQHEDPAQRARMRESIWSWILAAPRIQLGAARPEVQTAAMRELLHLPLLDEENAHLIRFLSHPPRTISPQALSLLHDLVVLRLIHQGRFAETIQLDKDLAGSGGREEDRQRRREMVREFIAILPDVQRRALMADSELRSAAREEEQTGIVDGPADSTQVVDVPHSWLATNGFSAPTTVETNGLAGPIAMAAQPRAVLDLARNTPLPSSPSQPLSRARPASPFTGPPRFASSSNFGLGHPGSPAGSRVASGSPFTLRQASVASGRATPMPRPPKKIINDDADPVVVQRSSRGDSRRLRTPGAASVPPEATLAPVQPVADAAAMNAEQDAAVDEHLAPPDMSPNLRRSTRRIISGASQPGTDQQKTPPPPSPQPPPKSRGRSNRLTADTASSSRTNAPHMARTGSGSLLPVPGSFPETVPEDSVPDIQPTPRRTTRAQPVPPPSSSRQRMTRSASLASMADEGQTPAPKRTRKAAAGASSRAGSLAPSEPDEGAQSVRRSTRRAGSAKPSERGSPTPSAQSVSGRKGSRAPSQTPQRATRSKKA